MLVFEEKDDTFSCYVTSSKTEDYIFIGSYSTLTTEFQYLDAATPLEDFKYIQKRITSLSTASPIMEIISMFLPMPTRQRTIKS